MSFQIEGVLVNTGHSIEWRASSASSQLSNKTSLNSKNKTISNPKAISITVSGGPLSYSYTLTHARLHFGDRDSQGSEHTISKYKFPAEVNQLKIIPLLLGGIMLNLEKFVIHEAPNLSKFILTYMYSDDDIGGGVLPVHWSKNSIIILLLLVRIKLNLCFSSSYYFSF